MASNPRIDDLRKKLERDPGSRLFAQLAEELRKAGDLDEAIVVSREGLQKHPAYPSARMTLGRALFDRRDLAGARGELEAVLKGAPDNILASRLLAECLEGLGDLRAAVEKYRVTLKMAPGDRQVAGRIEALEAKLESAARAPRAAPAPAAPAPEVAPIPLVAADEAFEIERPLEHVAAYSAPPPEHEGTVVPVPLAAADEAFEIERPYEYVPPAAAPPRAAEPIFEPEVEPVRAPEAIFVAPSAPPPRCGAPRGRLRVRRSGRAAGRLDPEGRRPPVRRCVAPRCSAPGGQAPRRPPPPDFVPEPPRMLLQSAEEPPPPWVAPPAPPAPEPPAPELISPTLAELYFNQGFTDKAIEVYQQILGREPGNERAIARLTELRQLEKPGAQADGQAARRQAIERVIANLEGLKASLRRE